MISSGWKDGVKVHWRTLTDLHLDETFRYFLLFNQPFKGFDRDLGRNGDGGIGLFAIGLAGMTTAAVPSSVIVGAIMPGADSLWNLHAVRHAIREINANPYILPATTLNLMFNTVELTDLAVGSIDTLLVAMQLFFPPTRSVGIIGTTNAELSHAISLASMVFQAPIVEPSTRASGLSARDFYVRVVPPDSGKVTALARMLVDVFDWNSMALLYSSRMSELAEIFQHDLATTHRVAVSHSFALGSELTEQLREVAESPTRIVVILADGAEACAVFEAASALGMTPTADATAGTRGTFAWAGVGWDSELWAHASTTEAQDAVRIGASGSVCISESQAYLSQPAYASWLDRWDADETVQANNWTSNGTIGVGENSAFIADATWALARALHGVCYMYEPSCELNMADGQYVVGALLTTLCVCNPAIHARPNAIRMRARPSRPAPERTSCGRFLPTHLTDGVLARASPIPAARPCRRA
jgi:hypothetical protein